MFYLMQKVAYVYLSDQIQKLFYCFLIVAPNFSSGYDLELTTALAKRILPDLAKAN